MIRIQENRTKQTTQLCYTLYSIRLQTVVLRTLQNHTASKHVAVGFLPLAPLRCLEAGGAGPSQAWPWRYAPLMPRMLPEFVGIRVFMQQTQQIRASKHHLRTAKPFNRRPHVKTKPE